MPTGTLLIGVEEGHNLEDRGFVTKQNPLCQVNVGSITHKTDAARHGGANPIWEERWEALRTGAFQFDEQLQLFLAQTLHADHMTQSHVDYVVKLACITVRVLQFVGL